MPAVPPETQTANYAWIKPYPTGSVSTWGATLNADLDQIDSALYAVANPNSATIGSIPATSVKGTLAFLNSQAPAGQQTRWALIEDTVAETGSDAGSNFSLAAYHDNGTPTSVTPMAFNRASGAVTFGGAATFSSSLAVTGVVTSKGVVDGSNAAAGQPGEFLTASASASLSWNTPTSVVSLPLTPGDWDVWGSFYMPGGTGGTLATTMACALSTIANASNVAFGYVGPANPGANAAQAACVHPMRLNLTTATTVYLTVALYGSGGGTLPTQGFLYARRAR